MKKTMLMVAILGMPVASLAHADLMLKNTILPSETGGLVGNGGGTVVCKDSKGHIKSIEVLDLYEARTQRGLTLDIQNFPGNWKQKAQAIINRLEAKSELRFQLYSAWLSTFESEYRVLTNVVFSTVPDNGTFGVPPGCDYEQAAIQRTPIVSGDPRYWLDATLWNAMDDTQKAALVLHEMIYREAIGYGHTDSIRSRYLTGLYASTSFAAQTLNAYWQFLEQVHFEETDVPMMDSMKGGLSSVFDPTRLWQPGPDQIGKVNTLNFQDRVVAQVGTCSNGCDTFQPTGLWQKYPLTDPTDSSKSLSAGIDNESITIGQTTIQPNIGAIDPTGQEIQNTLSGLVLLFNDDMPQNTLPIIDFNASGGSFSVVDQGPQARSAFGVNDFMIVKEQAGNWAWSSITAQSVSSGHISVTGINTVAEIPLVNSSNAACLISVVYYQSDAPVLVSPIPLGAVNAAAGCNNSTNTSYLTVSNLFANGRADENDPVNINSANSGIAFDASHPNTFQDSNGNYSFWTSIDFGSDMNNSTILCLTTSNSSCLQPTFNANRVVNQFTVIGNGPVASLHVGWMYSPVNGNGNVTTTVGSSTFSNLSASVLGGTTVTLFPSGHVQTFVNAESGSFTVNNQQVTIPANATVTLDDSGNIVSF